MKMKKNLNTIFGAGIILILLCFTLTGASSPPRTRTTNDQTQQLLDDYTHNVLVEACTAAYCPPCAQAARVMHDIFYSGKYQFYYVALVADENSYASQRCSELGVTSIPDYVFDGGYTRHVGSGGLPSAYTNRLDQSGARNVADIDLDLDITWNGDAQIGINLNITNNGGSEYHGHLHVYVTEIESRWDTYYNEPYHFAMVGNYGFNENVDIPAGETSEHTTIWDGGSYGVGDLQEDNVLIIATLFNRDNNNYVDETAAASFIELWPPYLDLEIQGIFGGVQAKLTNNGTSEITDISWGIEITGGILGLINVATDGMVDVLAEDEQVNLKTDRIIIGLGKISINVNIDTWKKTAQGFALGPLVLIV